MNDLIRRQDAIDAVISLCDECDYGYCGSCRINYPGEKDAKKALEDLPSAQSTADSVSVVCCKDCDNWDTEWKPIWGTERYCFTLDHITAGNFFCAYGERKKQPKTETETDHWGYDRLFCPNCKAQYTKGQRYCDNCGQKLI